MLPARRGVAPDLENGRVFSKYKDEIIGFKRRELVR